ncbi:uncharacterized protein PG986_005782 [Apiospora aurea]|uniref:Rhodopsin domain-containing protein n=1 Tax=Apiospora aurea TaxID=335848 RepID=A0ABR1QIR7_9PEZI
MFSKSVNFTWDGRKAGSWSLIELYVAIVCTCLPAFRIMAMAVGARFFGWNNSMTTRYGNGSKFGYGQGYGTSSKLARSHKSLAKSASTTTMLNPAASGDFIRLHDIGAGNGGSGNGKPSGYGMSENTLVGSAGGGGGGRQIHVTRPVVVSSRESPRR